MGAIPIYVINLERSVERKAKIQEALDSAGLPFEFIVATDGKRLQGQDLARAYDPEMAFATIGRTLHPNEIGCCLSHIEIWKRICDERIEKALIFEDDMLVTHDLGILLERSEDWLPEDWGIINFAHDLGEPRKIGVVPVVKTSREYELCEFNNTVGRSGAYLIRREAAKRLLDSAYPIRMPIDDLMGRPKFGGGTIYGFLPRPAIWNEEVASDIWEDRMMGEHIRQSRSGLQGYYRRIRDRITRAFLGKNKEKGYKSNK